MHSLLFPALGLVASYLLSGCLDISRFLRCRLRVLKAIRRCKVPMLMSVLLRGLIIWLVYHAIIATSVLLHGGSMDAETNGADWLMLNLFAAVVGAVIVVFIPRLMHPEHASLTNLRFGWFTRLLLHAEQSCWPRLIQEMGDLETEEIEHLVRGKSSQKAIFVLYEENIFKVINHHYNFRQQYPERFWMRLAFYTGIENRIRAEALLGVWGLRRLKAEMQQLTSKKRKSLLPVEKDCRKPVPTDWLVNPPLDTLAADKRKAYRLVAELLNFRTT